MSAAPALRVEVDPELPAPTPTHPPARDYRPDIDGLRGIAVTLVILFHLGVAPALVGGFVGVDVFFVISGFLITRILLDGLGSGSHSLAGFYERRVRRIVPALLLVVLSVLLAGYFLLLPGDYLQLARSALWALGAASNVFFLDNTGYFDAEANSMPLLHTWSLGVEEQFYFVWPLFLALVVKATRGRTVFLASLLIVAIVASFAYNLHQVGVAPKAAFFLCPPRAWELALGGLLVLGPRWRGGRWARGVAELLPVVGLALIIWSAFSISPERPFPGWIGLAPVIGAGLIVHDSGHSTFAQRLLGARPLVLLGKISYSAYLWHWPLIVYWKLYSTKKVLTPGAALGLTAVILVLSALSWRWIEQPGRQRAGSRKGVFGRAALAMGAVALVAFAIVRTNGVEARLPEPARKLGDLAVMWKWTCPQSVKTGLPSSGTTKDCVVGAPWATSRHRAILWGDSFAEHVLPEFDVAGRETDTAIAAVNPCPAILDDATLWRDFPNLPAYNQECAGQRAKTLGYLAQHDDVEFVILASSWGMLAYLVQGADGAPPERTKGTALMAKALDGLISQLGAMGRHVILFADTPRMPASDPSACAVAQVSPLLRDCPSDLGAVSWQSAMVTLKPTADMLREVDARHANVTLLDPTDRLCSDKRCLTEINGEFLYRDGGHLRRNLSPETTRQLAERLQLSTLLRKAIASHQSHQSIVTLGGATSSVDLDPALQP